MKRLLHTLASLGLLPIVATACADPGFEQFSEIRKLRVLGISMDPPEIGPGEASTITALAVVPPESTTEIVSWSWDVCAFIEGPDDFYACATFTDEETGQEFLAGVEGISTSPELVLPYEVLEAFGIPNEVCEGFQDVEIPEFAAFPDCTRGFPMTVRVTVATADGQEEIATTEILALFEDEAQRDDVNVNPRLGPLFVDDIPADGPQPVAIPYPENDSHLLLTSTDGESNSQFYEPVDPDNDGQRLEEESESLAITWFASRGRLDNENTYFARDIANEGEFQLNELDLADGEVATVGDIVDIHAVIRDDRGGLSYRTWQIELVAP